MEQERHLVGDEIITNSGVLVLQPDGQWQPKYSFDNYVQSEDPMAYDPLHDRPATVDCNTGFLSAHYPQFRGVSDDVVVFRLPMQNMTVDSATKMGNDLVDSLSILFGRVSSYGNGVDRFSARMMRQTLEGIKNNFNHLYTKTWTIVVLGQSRHDGTSLQVAGMGSPEQFVGISTVFQAIINGLTHPGYTIPLDQIDIALATGRKGSQSLNPASFLPRGTRILSSIDCVNLTNAMSGAVSQRLTFQNSSEVRLITMLKLFLAYSGVKTAPVAAITTGVSNETLDDLLKLRQNFEVEDLKNKLVAQAIPSMSIPPNLNIARSSWDGIFNDQHQVTRILHEIASGNARQLGHIPRDQAGRYFAIAATLTGVL